MRSLVAMLLALAAVSCGGADPPSGPSVVLVSIDSLRADHTSLHGYRPRFAPEVRTTPFLEELAAEGVAFEQAVSSTSWTLPAHASLFTGLTCTEHGVHDRDRRLPEAAVPIAERFREAGYETAGFFSGPLLHPAFGFARGFDVYRGVVDYSMPVEAVAAKERRGMVEIYQASHIDAQCSERVVDRALAWLSEGGRAERPYFLFLHLWDPHYDYLPPAELLARFDPEYEGEASSGKLMAPRVMWSGRDLEHLIARYDAEIRYTDDQLARFWRRLGELDGADDTIIIVTSDHGEEFFEHGEKGHQKSLFDEVVRVPLVLRAPGRVPAGLRVGQQVGLVDVAPTLLDLCDLPALAGASGTSVRGLWEGDETAEREHLLELVLPQWRMEMRALRTRRDKLLWDGVEGAGARYDLERDPGEQRGEEIGAWSAEALDRLRAAQGRAEAAALPAAGMELPEEIERELARLGYL